MSIDNIKQTIDYAIPLTAPSGKIRVKRRSILNEYGVPVATKSNPFSLANYIEWQIGYDIVTAEINESTVTSLIDKQFIGANGKTKSLYELSEIAYYFVRWGLISQNDVKNVYDFLLSINSEILIDVH